MVRVGSRHGPLGVPLALIVLNSGRDPFGGTAGQSEDRTSGASPLLGIRLRST
jgi:hypothetical protein